MRKHGPNDIAFRRLLAAEADARQENATLQQHADGLHDRAGREAGRLSKQYHEADDAARDSLGRAYQNAANTRSFAGMLAGSCRELAKRLGMLPDAGE